MGDLVEIKNLDDPRVAAYRNLKDRELARQGGRFIAEGDQVVRRLVASTYSCESILASQKRAAEMVEIAPAGVPVYVMSDQVLRDVIGYPFHSGALACGLRKPPATVAQLLPARRRVTVVVCPEMSNNENLGAMMRLCAGFGVDLLLLGERSADPFFRQSIRVSMGTVFRLPLIHSQDLEKDLQTLREMGVELVATVLEDDVESLASAGRGERLALLFGNEAQGLGEREISLCDRRVTIPMKLGTDSLNVGVAAGIFLYHFTLRV